MKLFSKSRGIPDVRKPDYDFIRDAEKEFRMDDDGFDERMDEAILENSDFKEVNYYNMDIDELDKFIDKCRDLGSELNSIKYKDELLDFIERMERRRFRLSRRDWDQRHYDLRNKMVERGKRSN